jgi:hypothetical protein
MERGNKGERPKTRRGEEIPDDKGRRQKEGGVGTESNIDSLLWVCELSED